MHPKNDVRKKIFVVATPITLSAMSWMVEIWTPEKHQKWDPQKGRGEYLSIHFFYFTLDTHLFYLTVTFFHSLLDTHLLLLVTWHSPCFFTCYLTLTFFYLSLDTHLLLPLDTWHSPSFTWYTWHSPSFLVVFSIWTKEDFFASKTYGKNFTN